MTAAHPSPGGRSAAHDPVHLYLTEIGRRPLLTKADETRLGQAIEAGRAARKELAAGRPLAPDVRSELERRRAAGDAAVEMFITANLRLVVSLAKKCSTGDLALLDLVQEGNLGLMHAVEKFDWRKGFRFSTYASWWIRQAMSRAISNTGRTVRLPVHAGVRVTRVSRACNRLEAELGRRPTVAEVAADLGLAEQRVIDTLRYADGPLSLSEPLMEGGDDLLSDVVVDCAAVSPFEAAAAALLPRQIAKILVGLDEQEQEILRLHFGLDGEQPRTLAQVAARLGLSAQRVRQIEVGAITKLRRPVTYRQVRDMLQSG